MTVMIGLFGYMLVIYPLEGNMLDSSPINLASFITNIEVATLVPDEAEIPL
jgi:hypothetical protein